MTAVALATFDRSSALTRNPIPTTAWFPGTSLRDSLRSLVDTTAECPFVLECRKEGYADEIGGKPDDITVLIATLVHEPTICSMKFIVLSLLCSEFGRF